MREFFLILFGLFITYIYFWHLKKEVFLIKNKKRSFIFSFFSRMALLSILFLPILLFFKEAGVVSILSFLIFRYIYLYISKKVILK